MAANATVQVDVKTTADTSGIRDVVAEAKELAAQGKLTKQAMDELGVSLEGVGRGKFTLVANEAKGVAAEVKGIATAAAAVPPEVEKTNNALNIGRFQAAALSREIANGTVNARTLGVSLSSFGQGFSVAAIAAFTVFEVIEKITEAMEKATVLAAKENTELAKSVEQLAQMAKYATDVGATADIGDAAAKNIEKARTELDAFNRTELNFITKFADQLARAVTPGGGAPGAIGPFQAERIREAEQAQQRLNSAVQAGNVMMDAADRSITEFAKAEQDLPAGIVTYTQKLDEAKQRYTDLTAKVHESNAAQLDPALEAARKKAADDVKELQKELDQLKALQKQYTTAVEESAKAWDKVVAAMGKAIDADAEDADKSNQHDINAIIAAGKRSDALQKIADQDRILLDAGNAELVIQDKVTQRVHERSIELRQAGVYGDENTKQALAAGEALRHQLEVQEGLDRSQKSYNVSLKQAEEILQAIRLAQTVIEGQPFLGADQKQVQMMQAYRLELGLVTQAMTKLKTDIAGGGLDPNVLEQDKTKLQQLVAQYIILQQKIGAGSKSLQSELQTWANGFGTTMHQLASTIEQTVGVGLQSLNTYLTTGKFNAQQLLQSIIQLGLQLVEQMVIQRVVAAINADANATLAAVAGKAIALAYGPAATAATIATTGAAAAEAPGAVAGALASIMGILGGGSTLHSGGEVIRRMHSGGLAHDEVPIIAQEGEIMIQRSVAQQPGMGEFLLGLNSGIFHDGGFIAGERYHRGGFEGGDPLTFADLIRAGPDFSGFSDYDPSARMTLERLAGFGFLGGMGTPGFLQGPTMIPTTFDTGGYPYAIQAALPPSDTGTSQQLHAGFQFKPKHLGGVIGQLHSGGVMPRLHSGGSAIRSQASSGANRSAGVHIYAFTDLKQLTKHMSSREGQKIIFDTVKGRRIDLGIT